ncbi:MAG TPA: HNH endonuclease domain-containing protein [Egibacteraceae bacterium]|nr:HNH endonuclease domain-containing protein [Egibacteraceae bacterium]
MSGQGEEAADPVVFAERLLALLDSGNFTMSYKYAVLLALVDACLEGLTDTGEPPDHLRARAVADKVLELYWRQAMPYPAAADTRVLRQRPELPKLDLVARIAAYREGAGFDRSMREAAAADPEGFTVLRERVFVTIVRMPLPKLQRLNRDDPFGDGFLYRIDWPDEVSEARVRRAEFDDRIHLKPGVAAMLVRLAGLVRPIVQRRWADFVARRNTDVLDDLTLDEFLFGAERIGLHRVRPHLVELQGGECFYCQDAMRGRVDIDHFLPWSRSGDDGIDNLVAAHTRCNNAKRASLAADDHLGRWLHRSDQGSRDLQAIADRAPWPRHVDKTMAVARALYLYQAPGTSLWVAPDIYRPAGRGVLRRLLVAGATEAQAAEHRPPYIW